MQLVHHANQRGAHEECNNNIGFALDKCASFSRLHVLWTWRGVLASCPWEHSVGTAKHRGIDCIKTRFFTCKSTATLVFTNPTKNVSILWTKLFHGQKNLQVIFNSEVQCDLLRSINHFCKHPLNCLFLVEEELAVQPHLSLSKAQSWNTCACYWP